MKRRKSVAALLVVAAAVGGVAQTSAVQVHAAPAPEVEYMYNVTVRRHYNFPRNDAVGYGRGICDKLRSGDSYVQVMDDVKNDGTASDDSAANFLVSYSVNLLCPDLIWQLRNSSSGYRRQGDWPS